MLSERVEYWVVRDMPNGEQHERMHCEDPEDAISNRDALTAGAPNSIFHAIKRTITEEIL